MDGRKEITRNPEAYSQSNREMLRFIRNIIAYRTDHKFKTLDDIYNKINSWLPGLSNLGELSKRQSTTLTPQGEMEMQLTY